MGVRIERTELPGIGVRHDLITGRGRRIGVVNFRDGRRELAIFSLDDPDSCQVSMPISDAEASTLAELLGTSVLLSKLTDLSETPTGLFSEHLLLPNDSVYAGRPLGETKARRRTGVSIVAIVRDNNTVIPSPGPDEIIEGGDALIAVGTRRGLDALSDLIVSHSG